MERFRSGTTSRTNMIRGILVFCSGLLLAQPARTEEPLGAAPHKATISKDGKEEERKFDLNNREDVESYLKLLDEGWLARSWEPDNPPNILDLRWDLGIWTMAVFVILLAILGKMAWKPMLEGLQKREENIRGQLDEARHANEDAKKLRSQLQQESDQAQEKLRQLLDEGRRDAERAKDEMLAKTRGEIQTERDRLRREIGLARDQALHEIWGQAANLATLISAKAIRRQLNTEDHRRLVDEAIADLRATSGTPNA